MESPVSEELLDHLCRIRALSRQEALHLIEEILAFYNESLEDFVARRHRELQASGYSNPAIYSAIGRELDQRRFPAPPLSERQIRRMIYG
ncbi:MAG: hypothetical protein KDJ38_10080 [Gammaproteobacteria bacterium]|nr:hypothetical protein [Gammaproteobacteria bacterium]